LASLNIDAKPFVSLLILLLNFKVTHLRSFQNYCRESMSDAFVLDNWMARFLTEHSSALSERRDISANPSPLGVDEPLSHQPGPNDGMPSGSSSDSQMEICASSGSTGTKPRMDPAADYNDLSQLLDDRGMSGEAIVNSALNWLLDDDLRMEQAP
jgi:hypothetical protein